MLEPNDGKSLSINFNNERTPSAYASAETSPNPSLISSTSLQSIRSSLATNCDDLTKSKLSPSASISSLLGQKIDPAIHAMSIDDPSIVLSSSSSFNHPLSDLTGPSIKTVQSSTSSNAIDKLLRQEELKSNDYQSLPTNMIFGCSKNTYLNQTKEIPGESQAIQDLVKSTVKTLIENTVKSSIEEVTKEANLEKEKLLSTKNLMPSLFPASISLKSTVSSSSPNPECSPFKLLVNELPNNASNLHKSPSATSKSATTLSPNGSTIHEAVAIFNSEKSKTNDKVIESLAMLNRKDHEKADPILSASTKTSIESKTNAPIETKIMPSVTSDLKSNTTKVTCNNGMSVPASSQEFCMNLNLNLAAAAAANAAGPIVVCDNAKLNVSPKETNQQQSHLSEHHRFTSNASTSSIHNDLKMILEESKGQGSTTSTEEEKEKKQDKKDGNKDEKKSQQQKDAPKPQREKNQKNKSSNKNKLDKHNKSKDSKSDSLNKSNKDDLLNLVKLMKTMSENKGKPHLENDNQPGHYRYTKEFLTQIRNERAQFIDNIYPEVFKAYCYCMNGKYWDPEKYFDIIQYSGEFERLVQQHQNNQQTLPAYINNNINNKNYLNNKQNNNQKSNNLMKKKSASNKMNGKSFENDSNNNLKNTLVNLGLISNDHNSKLDADKVLLSLLKNNNSQKDLDKVNSTQSPNLMEMLNKKQSNNTNILNELFNQNQSVKSTSLASTTSIPRHFPVILTAQELELSQMNKPENRIFSALTKTPDLEHKLKANSVSPSSCSSNSCTSECSTDTSNAEPGNSSEAYKQLIKNLSNHPLCTPPSSNRGSSIDNVLIKLQQKKTDKDLHSNVSHEPNASNDGSNLLKQLLNLNTDNIDNATTDEKKTKHKRNHHHHHHHHHHRNQQQKNKQVDVNGKLITSVESTTTTTTTTTITKTQFPSINPHEKPFQDYSSEKSLNLVNKLPSSSNAQTVNDKSTLENLISKIKQTNKEEQVLNNQKNEQDHFNSLINKIMPTQKAQLKQEKVETNQSDILKWFSGMNLNNQSSNKPNFSAKTLSEIELMSGHFP